MRAWPKGECGNKTVADNCPDFVMPHIYPGDTPEVEIALLTIVAFAVIVSLVVVARFLGGAQ